MLRLSACDSAHDKAVLSCGTLHWAVHFIELQCFCTVHEHCSWALFQKKKKEEFRLIQRIFDWSNPCLDHFIKLNWKVLLVKSIQAIDLDTILETQ